MGLAELFRLFLTFRDKHMARDQNIVDANTAGRTPRTHRGITELFLNGRSGLESRTQSHSRPLGDVARRLGTDGADPNRWMRLWYGRGHMSTSYNDRNWPSWLSRSWSKP